MNSCENSNKDVVFFHIAKSCFEITVAFEAQLIKEHLPEIARSHYLSPSFWNPWQGLICTVFTINVLKPNKRLFVEMS